MALNDWTIHDQVHGLKQVESRVFARCMGDLRKCGPDDNLCPSCEVVTRDEFIDGALRRYRDDCDVAFHSLYEALKP